MDNKPSYKLLPYEYQLIDALGITKSEYLDFVAEQKNYQDFKEGTILDIRNYEVAIVLIVIGTILQVVGALISSGQQPEQQPRGSAMGRREEIFSPRYGFNSQQELAKYGDPINLVYTNNEVNINGGVRIATSLLWSAVLSFGNSQLLRMMLVVGAGGIGAIDFTKTAFGETTLKDFISQNYWFYFQENYTGLLRNDHLKSSLDGLATSDPTKIGGAADNPFRLRIDKNTSKEGFSHCYSPSSANVFGIYGAVPINVNIITRGSDGRFNIAANEITLKINDTTTGYTENKKNTTGTKFTIILKHAPNTEAALAIEEARDQRRSLSTVFDNSGILKFGSIKLKILNTTAGDVVDGDMSVNMVVVNDGHTVSIKYADLSSNQVTKEDLNPLDYIAKEKKEYEFALKKANELLKKDDRPEIKTVKDLLADGFIKAGKYNKKTPQVQQIDATVGNVKKGGTYPKDIPGKTFSCPTGWKLTPVMDIYGKVYTAVCKKTTEVSSIAYKIEQKLDEEQKQYLQTVIDWEGVFASKINSLANDLFFTKAFVRIEEASYETNSPCHIVDFSIKARVFKRVNGRAPYYGSKPEGSGYRDSDNGYKYRSAMFLVKVKTSQEAAYTYMPCIFVIRRANDIDNYVYLRFISGLNDGAANAKQFQFKFEPIYDVASELQSHPELRSGPNGQVSYVYLENSGEVDNIQLLSNGSQLKNSKFEFTGKKRFSVLLPPVNEQPRDINEWDVFNNRSDTQCDFSFNNGPEFKLAAVTEQIIDSLGSYKSSGNESIYDNLSLTGLNLYSGKSVADVRSLSLFVTKGRKCKLLKTSGTNWGQEGFNYLPDNANGHANQAPDVFLDTVLDAKDGIGKYATISSVDIEQLARSKKFCQRNNLFMDGVIADLSSWRQFWANNASFSLLELAKIGGRDTLIPGLPYNKNNGEIVDTIAITALFNQGNIIEDSYKEEFLDFGENTQDAIVTVIHRKTTQENSFSQNATVQVQFADTIEKNSSRLTIDASQFVTNKGQAIKIGKLVCNTKRFSQRSIEFKTLPTDSPIFPGAFIYVELSHNQWDGIYTGIIGKNNSLNMALGTSIPNGNYSMLVYQQNSGANSTQSFTNVPITGNAAGSAVNLNNYEGYLFVIGTVVTNKRVFRVSEVQMDEEGEVTVRAVHHGTDANGKSLISRGIANFVNGLFLIDGASETSIIEL